LLLMSTAVWVARRIGINRMPKDITPDPLTYARQFDRLEFGDVMWAAPPNTQSYIVVCPFLAYGESSISSR
jgi:hypothetical protein